MANGISVLPALLTRKGSNANGCKMWLKNLDAIQKVGESGKEWKDFRNTAGIMRTSFSDATTSANFLIRCFIRQGKLKVRLFSKD